MEIRAQEIDRVGKSHLTIRANGRYLGTLWCLPDERDALLRLIGYGEDRCAHEQITFVHEARLK